MWGFGPMWGFGHLGWMAINSLFWLVLLVLGAVVVARILQGTGAPLGRSSALEILEQRYARGEIQREEYLQKKKDLTDRGPPA